MSSMSTAGPGQLERVEDAFRVAVLRTTGQILDEGRSAEKAEEVALIAASYADREMGNWREHPHAPAGIACRSGCSYCCHVPVAATIPEVVLIAAVLAEERDDRELAEVRDRVERHHRAGGGTPSGAGHACPMLDDTGACSIYEVRPMTCRGWNSLDLSRCRSAFDDPSRPASIPTDAVQRAMHLAIAAGIRDGLESRGLEHGDVDLVAALRIVLDDPDSVGRWLGGEPAFRQAMVRDRGPEVVAIGGSGADPKKFVGRDLDA